LEEQNILERSSEGYHLTTRGKELMSVHPLSSGTNRISLVKTLLPVSTPVEAIVPSLEGKWFGELRWLGLSQTPSETILKWITADGRVQLDAVFSSGELRIEGRLLRGDDVAGAIRVSYQLVNHISKAYLRPYPGRVLMYRNAPQSSLMPN
jgi:hypothetical protein